MYPVSQSFLDALASPHQVQVRADVSKGGVRLVSGLPVLGGEVTVDASSITRRRLTLELAPRLRTGTYADVATLDGDPFGPTGYFGQEITLQWGLTFTDGSTEWVPLGVFRTESVRGSLLSDGPVTLTGVSREAFVADSRFPAPTTRSSGSALSLIAALIQEVLPSVPVVASATMDRRVPTTTWDEDRWGAITDLAESIAAVVFCDALGRFVITDAPTTSAAPVWRASAGPGGVLVSAASSASRSRIYNAVIVRGESPSSDSPPVREWAWDSAASSPTLWGDPHAGAYGRRPRFMFLPTVTTSAQAQAIADANLARYVGAGATVDVSTVPNVALDAGDVIDIVTDATDPAGSVRRHAIDTARMSLSPGGAFELSTRDMKDVSDA